MMPEKKRPDNWLLYDGECPFCSRYVRLIKLQQAIGPLRLVNAREKTAEAEIIRKAGFDIDEGMVLSLNNQFYHGDECLHRLALLSTPVGFFNRINALLFRSQRLSRMSYPILRASRNLTLHIL